MWFENAGNCDVSQGYETPGYFYSIDNRSTWQSDPNFIVNTGQHTILIKDGTGTFYLFHLPVFPSCPLQLNTSIRDAFIGNDTSIASCQPLPLHVSDVNITNGK
jgi:hypothetical protein